MKNKQLEQKNEPGVFILDELDRKILAALDINCRENTTDLAEKFSSTRQTIEYRIKRLWNEGVITAFHTSFNPNRMGYRLYKVYLKIKKNNPRKDDLRQYLNNIGNVYWWGETSGSWDMLVGIFYKSELDLFRITNNLIAQFNDLITREHGHTIVDMMQFPKMYFTGELKNYRLYSGEITQANLDKLDYQILAEVLNDARITVAEIANNIGSTHAIVRGRLAKLEQSGVIYQYRISVNYQKLGLENYKTIVNLEEYTEADENNLIEHLSKLSNIEFFIRNIWQIEFGFTVSEFQDYRNILEDFKAKFPKIIRSVDTLKVLNSSWTKGFKNLI